MMAATSGRHSSAVVISILALIVSLGGGAYALTGIGARQMREGTLASSRSASGGGSVGYITNREAVIAMPADANTRMAKLSLPRRARYIISASATIGASSATQGFWNCQIRDDGKVIGSGAEATDVVAAYTDTVSLIAGSNGGKIILRCQPNINGSARHRVITAIKVGTLKSQP